MKDITKNRKLTGPILIRSDCLSFMESDDPEQLQLQIFADCDHQHLLILEQKMKKMDADFPKIEEMLQILERKLMAPETQQTKVAAGRNRNKEIKQKKPKLLSADQMDSEYVPCWPDDQNAVKYKRKDIKYIYILDSLADASGKAWDVSAERDGSVKCWVNQVGNSNVLFIAGEGGVTADEDSHKLFMDYSSAAAMNVNALDVSGVRNMSEMFAYCTNLETLDLSGWDVSNAETMRAMFLYCKSLKKIKLSNWKTDRVKDMSDMFSICANLSEIDVRNWNTSRVTSMRSMFNRCESISSLDLSRWDLSNVNDFSFMFQSCENLETLKMNMNMAAGSARKQCMFNLCKKVAIVVPSVD